ncbi:cysteine--tRNA ligase [Elusimicrobiota bacterium]
MSSLFLYNTLSGNKEEFIPLDPPRVNMYVCGITPYSEAHLGHARCYVVFDTLNRYMRCLGYDVNYIQNITDIDDKIINKSKETGEEPREIAEKYFKSFSDSMELLNVKPADKYPRVSETIEDIIKFVEGLIQKDMAYEVNGSIYFRVKDFKDYGQLSGRNSEELISQRDSSSDEKEDPRDFALWKSDKEFGWDSPWGKGRPGWHIECSAMSRKFLGDEFDIHGGGLDLIFPHHENEVTQSEALTGKKPVKYWVHNGMVTLRGDKMAKSTGNFFLLRDLLSEFPPMVVRMYLLTSGYRQVLDFNTEGIEDVHRAYTKIAEFKKEIDEIGGKNIGIENICKIEDEIISALNDDLNTARAIGEVFKKVNPIMENIFKGVQTAQDIETGKRLVMVFEEILGIKLNIDTDINEEEVELLLKEREKCRKEKDYTMADSIRVKLSEMGVTIKDTPSGVKWFKK